MGISLDFNEFLPWSVLAESNRCLCGGGADRRGCLLTGKTFLAARTVCKQGNVELIHSLLQQALKVLRFGDAFIDLHPQTRLVALLEQAPANATTAGQPRLHGADEEFGLVSVLGGYAVIDVVMVQNSGQRIGLWFEC